METLVVAFDHGDSPEEIHEQYPSVSLERCVRGAHLVAVAKRK